jgi:hypothetical protein
MIRPTKDLKNHQNYIIELFVDKKLNYNKIASYLRRYKGKDVKGITVKRRLKVWNIQKRHRIQNIDAFENRLKFYFYEKALNDKDITVQLNKKGWAIGQRYIKAYRALISIKIRIHNNERVATNNKAREIVRIELENRII